MTDEKWHILELFDLKREIFRCVSKQIRVYPEGKNKQAGTDLTILKSWPSSSGCRRILSAPMSGILIQWGHVSAYAALFEGLLVFLTAPVSHCFGPQRPTTGQSFTNGSGSTFRKKQLQFWSNTSLTASINNINHINLPSFVWKKYWIPAYGDPVYR